MGHRGVGRGGLNGPDMYMKRVTALSFDSMLKRLNCALVDSFFQSRKPKQGPVEGEAALL